MNKKQLIICAFALSMGTAISGFANPCMPIAQACMQEGYYRGGNTVGKGLVENCVLPIVEKRKSLANKTFDEGMMQQCKAMILEKIRAKKGN